MRIPSTLVCVLYCTVLRIVLYVTPVPGVRYELKAEPAYRDIHYISLYLSILHPSFIQARYIMQLLTRVSSQRLLARCQPIQTSYSCLCQPRLWILQPSLHNSANKTRSLTSTTPLYKKRAKSKPLPTTAPEPNTSKNAPLTDDPYDLSRVESGIANAVSRLKDNLSKLRAGGRFNTDAVENLPVHLKKGNKESVKLGELAQVVPKSGRMTTVLVAEEEVRFVYSSNTAQLLGFE